MCRCAERRTKIVEAAGALARGDFDAVKAATAFIVTTSTQDVRRAGASLAAAHARLARR